ncbi:Uu.00g133960.m01.CDS01 [Anthostomella pinea]|uniref:Uu.00g133960.m01.CDS01 n=1 Tax=Anthostomella pinea TaxID=933095 RepID=A0AAI8YKR4_9PEZI|nr:Uu.00g133960.m01.CDS01 [Anthostomella pinea]
MSYARLDDGGGEEESEKLAGGAHIELSPLKPPTPTSTSTPPKRHGQGRFFKTPHALHGGISIAAGATMMLFGYEQGVFGGIIVGHSFLSYFQHPSPAQQGWVTACYDLGCFAGALLALFIGETLGRRRMLLVFTVIMASGIVLQTAAGSMDMMVWGRIVAGIGNGGNTATAPVWHVETAHHSAKGMAVVKEMAVNILGFAIASFITLACSPLLTEAQWRFPLGIQLLFVVVILVLVAMLPESPRWLLSRNRDAEAKHVMLLLNSHDIEAEFESIRQSVQAEQAAQASWVQLFHGGRATRRVALGMLLQSFQQLSGVNVLGYYLPVVLHRSVGLPELTARWVSAANAVSYFFAASASVAWIDRVGRRPLLMGGAAAMSLAFLGVGVGVGVGDAMPGNAVPGTVATVFIWFFFTSFASGWLSVPWLYPAEVNSLGMRTKGAALATACDWLFNWAVVQATPPGITHLGWGFYMIFAVLNAVFVPVIYFLVVETRGRRLEDMDAWFDANKSWFVHRADHFVHEKGQRKVVSDHLFRSIGIADDQEAMMEAFDGSDFESLVSDDEETRPSGAPLPMKLELGLVLDPEPEPELDLEMDLGMDLEMEPRLELGGCSLRRGEQVLGSDIKHSVQARVKLGADVL